MANKNNSPARRVMGMSELKPAAAPCPFCGSPHGYVERISLCSYAYICDCGARGQEIEELRFEMGDDADDGERLAIEAWNRRAEPEQQYKGANRYGVDARYFEEKLRLLIRDLGNYQADELRRVFERLADATGAEPDRVSRMDVLSLSEAARCLGVAQAKNDADAIASWKAESLRLESAICAKAAPEKVEPAWIPVCEQLPDDGDQLPVIGYNPDWVDEDTNPEGVRECFLGGGGWINAEWNSYQDVYETRETAPTHWQPMPKAPQQEQK